MIDIDTYLQKTHHMKNYNCWDFIRDVWEELTGEDIGMRTPKLATRKNMKERFTEEEKHFKRLTEKQDPCIVLFKRGKMLPHVGIYLRGKVLHLPEKSNGKFEPLELVKMPFKNVRFYTWR